MLHNCGETYLRDGGKSHSIGSLGERSNVNVNLLGLSNLGSAGVAVLDDTSTAGEDHQSGLVALQALNVKVEGFLTLVGSSVINRYSNGLGELSVDSGRLDSITVILMLELQQL